MKTLEIIQTIVVIVFLVALMGAISYGFFTAPQEAQNMMMWMMILGN